MISGRKSLDNYGLGVNFAKVRSRIKIIIFFMVLVGLIYSGRLLYSGLISNVHKIMVIENKTVKALPFRKNIIDRNGNILATSLPIHSIAINPKKVLNKKEVIEKLYKIFPDLEYIKLNKQLNSDKQFVWIKRNITPRQEQKLNIEGIPGLLFEKDYKRIYPYKNLTAFITGYVDIDENGIAGIDLSFDKILKNNFDQNDLQLTLDIRLQQIARESLSKQIDKTKADAGLAIVVDVTNGEILAMVSLPDFDPHEPETYKSNELFNRASLGVYEFGSVFKPITVASALDSNSISISELFDSAPPLKIDKYYIHDFIPSKERFINPETILIKSSNIGTARIALKMGIETQRKYINALGLTKSIDVGLREAGYPIWPRKWTDVHSITASYGHGFAITPLHMVQAMATIVNNGLKCPLNLINKNAIPECDQIISPETSKQMRKILRQVVLKGSGKQAEVKDYCLGGKTGTSNKIHNGKYVKNESMASFIGIFPIYEPKYLILVSIDNPKGEKFDITGGAVSAPIAREIIEEIGAVLNFVVEPERCFFE